MHQLLKENRGELERQLCKMYVEESIPVSRIADSFGVSSGCIQCWLYRFKIPVDFKVRINHYLSKTHKEKISKALLGRKLSEEHCVSIGDGNRGKSKSLSESERRKRSERAKKPKSKEHCDNLSKGLIGRKLSEEHCGSISKSQSNPIVKRRNSDGHKKYRYEGLAVEEVNRRREFCFELLGKNCIKCGSVKRKLHFHHISTNLKRFEIWKGWSSFGVSIEDIEKELAGCLVLCSSCHPKLHRESYKYLVKVGLVDDYINWFVKCNNVELFNGYVEKGVVKHHIYLVGDECLYLYKGDHDRLHQHSLHYLSKRGRVEEYTSQWLM